MTGLTVSQLFVHPVKSLAGIEVNSVNLGELGPDYDRRWMIIDAKGKFLTQRQFPKMCLIKTQLLESVLILSTPDGDEYQLDKSARKSPQQQTQVRVRHDDVLAQDCGDQVADWLSRFLDFSVRLVFMQDQTKRYVDKDFALNSETVSFADGFPILVISLASLDLLNSKLDEAIDMRRFRPNIVIDGCEPHAEDNWNHIDFAGTTISLVKPCSRCIIPAIEPTTGDKQIAVIKALSDYRRGDDGQIYFGQNALIKTHSGQAIKVGDAVKVMD